MQQKKLIVTLGLVGIAVLGFLLVQTIEERVREQAVARMEVNPPFVDFGDIDQAGGIVSTNVSITNRGTKPLEFYRISTSCGCTTTEMDTSPLEHNASRILTIRFDPMAHPDQNGPITRVVYLQTSDPNQQETEIDVLGNVVPTNGIL